MAEDRSVFPSLFWRRQDEQSLGDAPNILPPPDLFWDLINRGLRLLSFTALNE